MLIAHGLYHGLYMQKDVFQEVRQGGGLSYLSRERVADLEVKLAGQAGRGGGEQGRRLQVRYVYLLNQTFFLLFSIIT